MGNYSSEEFLETFGGLPEPGEAYPSDPDALRDRLEEEERDRHEHERNLEAERERDLEARGE